MTEDRKDQIDRILGKLREIWLSYPECSLGQILVKTLQQMHHPVSELLISRNPDTDWEACMDTCFQGDESCPQS